MRFAARLATCLVLPLGLAACDPAAPQSPTVPSVGAPAAVRAQASAPRERSVLEALAAYERAILASDTVALKLLWAEDYTFINAQGVLATREQRLANFRSGATSVAEAVNQREITARVYGDNAVVQQLFTLRGRFGGVETDTEVRCTFVWLWRAGRWQMVANQLTPVLP
jgi:ketosteroid isomerase-like protein